MLSCVSQSNEGFTPVPGVYGSTPFASFETEPLFCDLPPTADIPFLPAREARLTIDGVEVSTVTTFDPAQARLTITVQSNASPGSCRGTIDAPPWVTAVYSSGEGGTEQVGAGRQMSCLPRVVFLQGEAGLVRSRELPTRKGGQRLVEVTVGLAELESATPGRVRSPVVARIHLRWDGSDLGELTVEAAERAEWGAPRPGRYLTASTPRSCPTERPAGHRPPASESRS